MGGSSHPGGLPGGGSSWSPRPGSEQGKKWKGVNTSGSELPKSDERKRGKKSARRKEVQRGRWRRKWSTGGGEKERKKDQGVSHSVLSASAIPRTVAHQDPLPMRFSRQEHWNGLPFPSPGDRPDPGVEPGSPALRADSLPSEPPGKATQAGLLPCRALHAPCRKHSFLHPVHPSISPQTVASESRPL